MPTFALFCLTFLLSVGSLIACSWQEQGRRAGAVSGGAVTFAAFLWLAWWQPFAEYPAAMHLALFGFGLAVALLLWRGPPAARAFGTSSALVMAGLVLFSAVIFPALTRPEGLAQAYRAKIEAVVGDRPYCTVAARQLSGDNPSFFATPWKSRVTPDWSSPRRFLYSWVDDATRDLTLFVRTGEPQLRLDFTFKFEFPGNLYDVAIYLWDRETATFLRPLQTVTVGEATYEASAIIDQSFMCIPRKDYLLTDMPKDSVGISTPYGDFALPGRLLPASFIAKWYFSTRTDGFYFTLPSADVFPTLKTAPALKFSFDPYERPEVSLGSHVYGPDHREIDSKAGLEAVGFAENQFGLLAASVGTAERSDNAMLAFDAAGNIVTSIECSSDNWCKHVILGPTVLAGPGASNTLWVSYSTDLLANWREIEAAAKAALVTFPVSGVVPGESLGRRPEPDCIGIIRNDGRCLAYDRLP